MCTLVSISWVALCTMEAPKVVDDHYNYIWVDRLWPDNTFEHVDDLLLLQLIIHSQIIGYLVHQIWSNNLISLELRWKQYF